MPPLDLPQSDDNLLVAHFRLFMPGIPKRKPSKQDLKRRGSTSAKNNSSNTSYTGGSTTAGSGNSSTSNGSPILRKDISSPILMSHMEDTVFAHSVNWIPAVGVLKRNGMLDLLYESDGSLIQSVNMTSVLSSRVRRIDKSLYDCLHVMYVQPSEGIIQTPILQNAIYATKDKLLSRQLSKEDCYFYVAFKDDNDYDDWFSTLKSFTRKRIFSPTNMNFNKSFRTARKINLRIIEARPDRMPQQPDEPSPFIDSYVEVAFENLVWTRTFVAYNEPRPFWREDFEFEDFPVRAPSLRLVVKRRLGARVSPKQDPVIGYVDISDMEILEAKDVEVWYPMTPGKEFKDVVSCSICVRFSYEQIEVLSKAHYYDKLHGLLTGNVANNLTIQIADQMPSELNRLSCILLNIFQTENKSVEWITSLISGELGKIRENFTQSSSYVTSDAKFNVDNTLFRGNSLVTKALERYMKLVGFNYLDKVVGNFVRKVIDVGLFVEVDPSRIPTQFIPNGKTAEEVSLENQEKLSKYVSYLWSTIRDSADQMPYSFKLLFKKLRLELSLRLQQEESVIFNAVSGFLFLRFFCPAILNPKVAGLVRAHPVQHVQRSLTLITKMLQGFANRVRFGLKEPWMVPLNSFIDAHDTEMTEFYRDITLTNQSDALLGASGIVTERPFKDVPFTPTMGDVYSNPYLIDQLESYARLIDLWCNRDNSFMPHDNDLLQGPNHSVKPPSATQGTLSQVGNGGTVAPATIIDASTEILEAPPRISEAGTVSEMKRPVSTSSSKFEEAISDALDEEDSILKRASKMSISSTAAVVGGPSSQAPPPSSSALSIGTQDSAPQHATGKSSSGSSLRSGNGDNGNKTVSATEATNDDGGGKSKKRNTLIAMQEDALKQFDMEAFLLNSKCIEIQQRLYKDEMIEDDSELFDQAPDDEHDTEQSMVDYYNSNVDGYIANTYFTYNPETSNITLRKHAVGFAQAAAASSGAQNGGSGTVNINSSPKQFPASPSFNAKTSNISSPISSLSTTFSFTASPQMNRSETMNFHPGLATTFEARGNGVRSSSASPTGRVKNNDYDNNDNDSDRQSTVNKRFPKWGFKFKRSQ